MHHDEHIYNVRIPHAEHGSLPLCFVCRNHCQWLSLASLPLSVCGKVKHFQSCGSIPSPPCFYHRTFLGTFAWTSSFSSCWNPNNLPKTPPGFGTGHSRASFSNI